MNHRQCSIWHGFPGNFFVVSVYHATGRIARLELQPSFLFIQFIKLWIRAESPACLSCLRRIARHDNPLPMLRYPGDLQHYQVPLPTDSYCCPVARDQNPHVQRQRLGWVSPLLSSVRIMRCSKVLWLEVFTFMWRDPDTIFKARKRFRQSKPFEVMTIHRIRDTG